MNCGIKSCRLRVFTLGLTTMLSQTAVSIVLEWTATPCPKQSWLDNWFLGSESDALSCSALVPFFLEVHKELLKSWKAPFSART